MTRTGQASLLRNGAAGRHAAIAACVSLLVPLWLAACGQTDPYTRPGTWVPTGVNAANLRAMIAVPSDLVAGHGDDRGNGEIAAMALDRFHRDAVRQLPNSLVSAVGASAGGSSGNSGGGGAGGGAPAGAPAPAADNGGT